MSLARTRTVSQLEESSQIIQTFYNVIDITAHTMGFIKMTKEAARDQKSEKFIYQYKYYAVISSKDRAKTSDQKIAQRKIIQIRT